MSLAYRCETCSGEPMWTFLRRGDAVVTWACADHINEVLQRLQRDREVTEVVTTLWAKAVEWAEIGRTLNAIAEGSPE